MRGRVKKFFFFAEGERHLRKLDGKGNGHDP